MSPWRLLLQFNILEKSEFFIADKNTDFKKTPKN